MSDVTELAQRMKAAALKAKHAGEAPIMHFDERISALKEFQLTACPANVVDLVEALEARDKQIAELRVSNRILCSDAMAKQERIAELEARTLTVKLPDYSEIYITEFASEIEHQVRKALEMAGVAVEGK
jgi:uncharacterized ferredoxin-like protein|nr:MAG TPA: hypothetical protein [Caudoviricetes sp.]